MDPELRMPSPQISSTRGIDLGVLGLKKGNVIHRGCIAGSTNQRIFDFLKNEVRLNVNQQDNEGNARFNTQNSGAYR